MIEKNARASWTLWLGVGTGLALALASLTSTPAAQGRAGLPTGAVAEVNGVLILRADYDAELQRMARIERRELGERDKRSAVERLVDDELMLARGLSLGMERADAATRHALLAAVFEAETADAAPPAPEEIERFHRDARAQLGEDAAPQLVRERVQRMAERYAAERAFAARIGALREAADIRIAEPLP